MRHVNAGIISKVDVIELGQSDGDHMSQTFFRDDVHFYNGFISNSFFVYHYELFLDVAAAHGVPSLVLYDIGSGYILRHEPEPEWDTPKESPVWWGFPPFHLGKAQPLPWYRDIPSLLSLPQTELTLTWLDHQLPHSAPPPSPESNVTETDNGQQFRCVDLNKPSQMYRWLADGSRVYHGEVGGVFAPPGQVRIEKGVGDRYINPDRVKVLDWVLAQLAATGTKVIVYSPPVHPAVLADGKQLAPLKAAGDAVRAVAEKNGLDFCDLAAEATTLGCGLGDFSDELHISRHCNERVIRRLATGCAPRAGALLKQMLKPSVLK